MPFRPALTSATGQPDELLAKIVADWDRRRDRVDVVRYQVSGEQVLPKGSTLNSDTEKPSGPSQPTQDIKLRKKVMLLLDLAKNHHRLELDRETFHRYLLESRGLEAREFAQ